MTRAHILEVLRGAEARLRAEGVTRLALFGSRARGDDSPASDVDILVHFDPQAGVTLLDLAKWRRELSASLNAEVQIMTAPIRRETLRASVERDAVYAF